jgi:hypothetical protein
MSTRAVDNFVNKSLLTRGKQTFTGFKLLSARVSPQKIRLKSDTCKAASSGRHFCACALHNTRNVNKYPGRIVTHASCERITNSTIHAIWQIRAGI